MQQAASLLTAVSGRTRDLSLSGYDFNLPAEAIAQRPAARRDGARLMAIDRETGLWRHGRFGELGVFFRAGDVLVVNDSKVVPARLRGRKASGGAVEVLLLERHGTDRWSVLFRTGRCPAPGTHIEFGAGLHGIWTENLGEGRAVVRLSADGDLETVLAEAGEVPLPPYIHRPLGPDEADRERYQTVYARVPGSVAAPTAGLHFTRELMENLGRRGVTVVSVTLHVGAATFQPVRSDDLEHLVLEGERYEVPPGTAKAIALARGNGGRVIAVGTTTTRALEAAADDLGMVRVAQGVARLAIRPGYRFRVIDGIITNFHLPRSSLLVLLAAFLGRETLLRCYAAAVAAGYRFYSYGDAMIACDQPHLPGGIRTPL